MRASHPLLCGTLLGMTWVMLSLLLQGADWLPAWALEREGLALLGMTAVGALIAAVPTLLRKRETAKISMAVCVRAFLCGIGMMLALRLAGSGRILSAMLEGSTGAFGFVLMAWLFGGATVRIAERRRT